MEINLTKKAEEETEKYAGGIWKSTEMELTSKMHLCIMG